MKKKSLSYVVGITTNYPKENLVHAVLSLRLNEGVDKNFPLIVIADSIPVEPRVKKVLKELNVKLIENSFESSAWAKCEQIINMTKADLVLLTQDDLLFDRKTVKNIIKAFESDPKLTFVGQVNKPLSGGNWVERAIAAGTNVVNRIGESWNNGDNYIAMFGRMMAFKTDWLRKLHVEKNSVSADAYLYFENKKMGGKYLCLWDTPLYFREPSNLSEHLRKSSRFQLSQKEMEEYRRFNNLGKEYQIPFGIRFKAMADEFVSNPINFVMYLFVYAYTRTMAIPASKCLTAMWEVDYSTKRI